MQIAMRHRNGDLVVDDPIPRTRSTDPDTSRQAEAFMRESGRHKEHQQEVLARVGLYPGRTARELDDLNLKFGKFGPCVSCHRRLPELERRGLVRRGEVRKCRVGGRNAATWWPA